MGVVPWWHRSSGSGSGYGSGSGPGYGSGSGPGYGDGSGSGSGYAYGDGYGGGNSYAYADGSDDGSGLGDGFGSCDGSGGGYGDRDGPGSGHGWGCCGWKVYVKPGEVDIGCEGHPIDAWLGSVGDRLVIDYEVPGVVRACLRAWMYGVRSKVMSDYA